MQRIGVLGRELRQRRGRLIVAGLPLLWLGLFFLLPFLIVAKISLTTIDPNVQPPYSSIVTLSQDWQLELHFNLDNYRRLWQDGLYLGAYLNSLRTAAISTLLCLLLGFPMALGIARARARWRAWIGLLKDQGPLNNLLLWLGLIDQPLHILYTNTAVYIGIVYSYLPFMVLPLTATLLRHDHSLLEAAFDLGCKPLRAFWRVTFPLSLPGVIAGSLLVFIPAVGEFVIPDLLGGPDSLMIGRVLWTEFFQSRDWPLASAVAMAILLLIVIPTLLFEHLQSRRGTQEARR
ncbi:ABC transporter permease subunit [Gammaproteobacteria bacterium PRO6]|nr:ABC transporter permease subunit [Gammaproteobacteria bacterium PRO6]